MKHAIKNYKSGQKNILSSPFKKRDIFYIFVNFYFRNSFRNTTVVHRLTTKKIFISYWSKNCLYKHWNSHVLFLFVIPTYAFLLFQCHLFIIQYHLILPALIGDYFSLSLIKALKKKALTNLVFPLQLHIWIEQLVFPDASYRFLKLFNKSWCFVCVFSEFSCFLICIY